MNVVFTFTVAAFLASLVCAVDHVWEWWETRRDDPIRQRARFTRALGETVIGRRGR